jgi:hypothetical protein
MAIENVVCPRCGRETIATIPSGQKLVRVVANPEYNGRDDPKCVVQMCKCSKCSNSFGAVTRDQF